MPIDSLGLALALFAAGGCVIAVAGVAMANAADRLADQSALGEAITGGVFLGASTSLSGIVTSVSTAAQGHVELAFANAVGGIPAQTFFLAIADIVYRRANLEHAAASLTNVTQGVLLVALLSLPLLASVLPPWQATSVHPVTIAIVVAYVLGVRLAAGMQAVPLWRPVQTRETRTDVADEPVQPRRAAVVTVPRFLGLALVVGSAGYVIGQAGLAISHTAGLSQTIVGALLTAVCTSLPELVTTIAAVRRGALTLALGGIIGGNMFDMLLVAGTDVAYREGSAYHAVSELSYLPIVLTVLMTAVLLLGMLRRQRHGIANIGFESVLLIVIYAGGVAALLAAS